MIAHTRTFLPALPLALAIAVLVAGCGEQSSARVDTSAMEDGIRGPLAEQIGERTGKKTLVESIDCIAQSDANGACIADLREGRNALRVHITVSIDPATGEYIWHVDQSTGTSDEPEDPYTITDAILSPSGSIACVALVGVSAETVGVRCGLRDGLGYEVFETGRAHATDAWEWPTSLGHIRTQPYEELVSVETGTFSEVDPYGESAGPLRCRIEPAAGVRCRNATHGFRVSRQQQYMF